MIRTTGRSLQRDGRVMLLHRDARSTVKGTPISGWSIQTSATVATIFPISPGKSRTMLAHMCAWETLNRSVEAPIRSAYMRLIRRMSLFLRRCAYKHMRIKTAVRYRQDHEVNERKMRCRTGTEEAVHIQSGQERPWGITFPGNKAPSL